MSDPVRRKRRVRKSGKQLSLSKTRMASAVLVFALAIGIIVWILIYQTPASSTKSTSFEVLRGVPVPEMPAYAVTIVSACNPDQRDAKIVEVLKSVSVLAAPGILPYMVSELDAHFPANLDTILSTAVDLEPDLVLVYAQISMQRLPTQIETISYILGKKTPWNVEAITRTMSERTRDLDAITRGLKRGMPEYQPPADDAGTPNLAGFIAVPGQTNQTLPSGLNTNQTSSSSENSVLIPPISE